MFLYSLALNLARSSSERCERENYIEYFVFNKLLFIRIICRPLNLKNNRFFIDLVMCCVVKHIDIM